MSFKVFNSRKLNKTQQMRALAEIKNFHQTIQEIENINNSIRYENKLIQREINELKFAKGDKKQKTKIKKLKSQFEKEIKAPTGSDLIKSLESKNLTYSKDNIYHDIRRNAMIYKSKSAEKSQKAQDWFDNYFEPFRKEKGLTTQQAHDLWVKAKEQTYDNLSVTELEYALELREIGSPKGNDDVI